MHTSGRLFCGKIELRRQNKKTKKWICSFRKDCERTSGLRRKRDSSSMTSDVSKVMFRIAMPSPSSNEAVNEAEETTRRANLLSRPIGVIGIAGTVSLIVLLVVIGLNNVIRNH